MPETLLIENACRDDLNFFYQEELKHFKNPWSLKNYEDEFAHPGSRLKKAVFKSRICGFAVSRTVLDELHILRICTVNEFQKNSIGTALLNSLIEDFRSLVTICLLEVRDDNIKALSFYKKNGFKITGKRKNYYGQGIDALNMTKDLSGGS